MRRVLISPFVWAFIFLLAWAGLSAPGWQEACCPFKTAGTYFGVFGYALFAAALLLSSRWRLLERWYGGLDQIYHLHRWVGIVGFCAILVHPWVIAFKWVPSRMDKFAWFLLPVHERLSVNLGSYAFWLMVVVLGITLLRLLPYNRWKVVHKLMTVVFILASLHIALSTHKFGGAYASALLYIPMAVGLFGIVYKQVVIAFFSRRISLTVSGIRHLNDNVTEVALQSEEAISYTPGQYGFFQFVGRKISKEAHPFTIVESGGDATTLYLLVKARGDWTRNFYQQIHIGDRALFEGPYGRFDYRCAGTRQIWIGGGVGIVPFLAWIRSMHTGPPVGTTIDLFYCMHRKEDAVYADEFQAFAERYPAFRCTICCTEDDNRLDLAKIKQVSGNLLGHKILMCGPLRLTRAFTQQLVQHGLPRADILFEDFEFY